MYLVKPTQPTIPNYIQEHANCFQPHVDVSCFVELVVMKEVAIEHVLSYHLYLSLVLLFELLLLMQRISSTI